MRELPLGVVDALASVGELGARGRELFARLVELGARLGGRGVERGARLGDGGVGGGARLVDRALRRRLLDRDPALEVLDPFFAQLDLDLVLGDAALGQIGRSSRPDLGPLVGELALEARCGDRRAPSRTAAPARARAERAVPALAVRSTESRLRRELPGEADRGALELLGFACFSTATTFASASAVARRASASRAPARRRRPPRRAPVRRARRPPCAPRRSRSRPRRAPPPRAPRSRARAARSCSLASRSLFAARSSASRSAFAARSATSALRRFEPRGRVAARGLELPAVARARSRRPCRRRAGRRCRRAPSRRRGRARPPRARVGLDRAPQRLGDVLRHRLGHRVGRARALLGILGAALASFARRRRRPRARARPPRARPPLDCGVGAGRAAEARLELGDPRFRGGEPVGDLAGVLRAPLGIGGLRVRGGHRRLELDEPIAPGVELLRQLGELGRELGRARLEACVAPPVASLSPSTAAAAWPARARRRSRRA